MPSRSTLADNFPGLFVVIGGIVISYSYYLYRQSILKSVSFADLNENITIVHGSCHCEQNIFRIRCYHKILIKRPVELKIHCYRLSINAQDFELLTSDEQLSSYTVKSANNVGFYSFCRLCGVHIMFTQSFDCPLVEINAACLDLHSLIQNNLIQNPSHLPNYINVSDVRSGNEIDISFIKPIMHDILTFIYSIPLFDVLSVDFCENSINSLNVDNVSDYDPLNKGTTITEIENAVLSSQTSIESSTVQPRTGNTELYQSLPIGNYSKWTTHPTNHETILTNRNDFEIQSEDTQGDMKSLSSLGTVESDMKTVPAPHSYQGLTSNPTDSSYNKTTLKSNQDINRESNGPKEVDQTHHNHLDSGPDSHEIDTNDDNDILDVMDSMVHHDVSVFDSIEDMNHQSNSSKSITLHPVSEDPSTLLQLKKYLQHHIKVSNPSMK